MRDAVSDELERDCMMWLRRRKAGRSFSVLIRRLHLL